MKKGDEASPSIILAGQSLLVQMLITIEPHGIFGSNFVYKCILNCPATGMKKVTRLHRASVWPIRFELTINDENRFEVFSLFQLSAIARKKSRQTSDCFGNIYMRF